VADMHNADASSAVDSLSVGFIAHSPIHGSSGSLQVVPNERWLSDVRSTLRDSGHDFFQPSAWRYWIDFFGCLIPAYIASGIFLGASMGSWPIRILGPRSVPLEARGNEWLQISLECFSRNHHFFPVSFFYATPSRSPQSPLLWDCR